MTPLALAMLHGAFEWAGVFVGARVYFGAGRISLRSLGATSDFAVLLGCLLGAAIGNKAVHWVQRADEWPLLLENPWLILQGQSMVGGLVGGLVGVEIAKKCVGLSTSTGDRFVAPILVGLAIGRIGCFLAGLEDDTYGNPTALPWGIDFGDGVPRHPTQLYEIAYALASLALLHRARDTLAREPGLQFKIMFASYLLWRLVIDTLKPVPYDYGFGLSGIQVVCAIVLVFYLPLVARQARRLAA